MRLQAALLLVAYICATAWAIFPDEVNNIDFHHALLGIPSTNHHSDSTFFHRPTSSSSASLLYTISDNLVVGAVNPKDGSLVWRQNLSQFAFDDQDSSSSSVNDRADGLVGFLRAGDASQSVVGAAGGYVSAWNALDGKLVWESRFKGGSVKDLELLELHDPTAEPGSRDVVAAFGRHTGAGVSTVRRLAGATGEVKWEFTDYRFDI